MIAWPIETSAVHGMFLMKYSRLSRLRSWPAFTSRPASRAASAVSMKPAIALSLSAG